MTTPRDPIEAPATAEALIERLNDEPIMADDGGFADWDGAVALADKALTAARDEGLQEAVRLREALEYLADRVEVSIRAPEGTELFDALEGARAALDDVARHGRSSDPEPAPDLRALLHEWTDDWDDPEPGVLCGACGEDGGHAADCLLMRSRAARGAVPALPATGEPPIATTVPAIRSPDHVAIVRPIVADRVPVNPPSRMLLAHLREFPALETSMRLIEKEVDSIEEAARTEGRREAVQLVRPVAEKALTYAGGSKFAADAARKVLATLDMAEGFLDEVAGLNASESPPTDENRGPLFMSQPETDEQVFGDASESGQPPEEPTRPPLNRDGTYNMAAAWQPGSKYRRETVERREANDE